MRQVSDVSQNFRTNVRLALEYRDITFAEIAEAHGMSKAGLSRLMTGKQDATLARAAAIADVLRIPLHVLIDRPSEFQEWVRSRRFFVNT